MNISGEPVLLVWLTLMALVQTARDGHAVLSLKPWSLEMNVCPETSAFIMKLERKSGNISVYEEFQDVILTEITSKPGRIKEFICSKGKSKLRTVLHWFLCARFDSDASCRVQRVTCFVSCRNAKAYFWKHPLSRSEKKEGKSLWSL